MVPGIRESIEQFMIQVTIRTNLNSSGQQEVPMFNPQPLIYQNEELANTLDVMSHDGDFCTPACDVHVNVALSSPNTCVIADV